VIEDSTSLLLLNLSSIIEASVTGSSNPCLNYAMSKHYHLQVG
jgi:hypothetical protein